MRQLNQLRDTCLADPVRYDAARGRYVTLADARIDRVMRRMETAALILEHVIVGLALATAVVFFIVH